MNTNVENFIRVARSAIHSLRDSKVGTTDQLVSAKNLELWVNRTESEDLVKRLKHVKFVLEDPRSQFLLIGDGSSSTRADLLEIVNYYLNLHKSE